MHIHKWWPQKNIGINGARIDGCYDDYIQLMAKKHHDGKNKLQGSVIVIDSYDGAEHHRRKNKKTVLYHLVHKCSPCQHYNLD